MLAELDGVRGFFKGAPLTTQLCYGNPAAREAVVNAIVAYCAAHPGVDYVHFWLGDSAHNHCECPLCRETRPSDFYVQMLRDLDRRLTHERLPHRIVFLIYEDLLWPPLAGEVPGGGRFTLMFAPVWRTYSQPFAAGLQDCEAPKPYRRNRNVMPSSAAENVGHLRAWRQKCPGADSFDFDYHFMWDHYLDAGGYALAGVLAEDIRSLDALGLNGLVSCQTQRAFFPTALGMHVLADSLWWGDRSFERVAADYFAAAFGSRGPAVQAYVRALSHRFHPPYLRGEEPILDAARSENYRGIGPFVREFLPEIRRALCAAPDEASRVSWQCLLDGSVLAVLLANCLAAKAAGDEAGWRTGFAQAKAFLCAAEDRLHPYFDLFEFLEAWQDRPHAPMQAES